MVVQLLSQLLGRCWRLHSVRVRSLLWDCLLWGLHTAGVQSLSLCPASRALLPGSKQRPGFAAGMAADCVSGRDACRAAEAVLELTWSCTPHTWSASWALQLGDLLLQPLALCPLSLPLLEQPLLKLRRLSLLCCARLCEDLQLLGMLGCCSWSCC